MRPAVPGSEDAASEIWFASLRPRPPVEVHVPLTERFVDFAEQDPLPDVHGDLLVDVPVELDHARSSNADEGWYPTLHGDR